MYSRVRIFLLHACYSKGSQNLSHQGTVQSLNGGDLWLQDQAIWINGCLNGWILTPQNLALESQNLVMIIQF